MVGLCASGGEGSPRGSAFVFCSVLVSGSRGGGGVEGMETVRVVCGLSGRAEGRESVRACDGWSGSDLCACLLSALASCLLSGPCVYLGSAPCACPSIDVFPGLSIYHCVSFRNDGSLCPSSDHAVSLLNAPVTAGMVPEIYWAPVRDEVVAMRPWVDASLRCLLIDPDRICDSSPGTCCVVGTRSPHAIQLTFSHPGSYSCSCSSDCSLFPWALQQAVLHH
jgi:hypothetical protein